MQTGVVGKLQSWKTQHSLSETEIEMSLQIAHRPLGHSSLIYRKRPAAKRLHTTVQAMVKATWQGAVLATSNDTQQVEGNHYFPPESINKEVGLLFEAQPLGLNCP